MMNAELSTEGATNGRRLAVIILLLGVLIRVSWLAAIDPTLQGDAASYHEAAQMLMGHQRFEPDWPPGVPAYLAALYQAVGSDSVWIARLSMMPLYVAVHFLMLRLGSRLASPAAALLAVALFAIFPSAIWASITPLTQLPTTLLLLVVCAAWDRWRRGELQNVRATMRQGAWLGIAMGALILIRSSTLSLLLVLPPLLLLQARHQQQLRKQLLVLTLVSASFAAMSTAGYVTWLHQRTSEWVFINRANAQNLFYGNNPDTPLYRTWWFGSHKSADEGVPASFSATHRQLGALPAAERDAAFSAAALTHIQDRPDLFLIRTVSRVRAYFGFDTFAGAQLQGMDNPRLPRTIHRGWTALTLLGDASIYLLCFGVVLLTSAVHFPFWTLNAWRTLLWPPSPFTAISPWVIPLGLSAAYAGPYFAVFAHATYHFPLLPFLFLGASAVLVTLARQLGTAALRADLMARLRVHRYAGLVLLLLAAALQAEWVLANAGLLPTRW
jgi:4-amino-4-deoxy-L-arabinose transferase-like glycosyltransferase